VDVAEGKIEEKETSPLIKDKTRIKKAK